MCYLARIAALGCTGWLLVAAQPVRAQEAQPAVPDIRQRSGLITRFTSIKSLLPQDPKRDTFWDYRYGDVPTQIGQNCMLDGGLYGRPLKADCTACVAPYFWGSPGKSTIGPHCKAPFPASRWLGNAPHPFRPVGMYYDRGCYVPIYDLDPWVPGPGPFPWRFYCNRWGCERNPG
jgi:hypothetical protein